MNIRKKKITETRELAKLEEIDLESLSYDDLRAIFDKEMEVQFENKTYDMTFLNRVAEAIGKADDPKFSEFWPKEYTAEDFRQLAETRQFTNKSSNADVTSNRKTLRIDKRISVIAACFILAVGMLTVTAYATVPSFSDMIRRTLRMPAGSSIADNGITYFNDDKSKEYSTIDELVRAEDLDKYGVLFPDDLPTELTISSMMIVNYNNETSIEVKFTDDNISMGIKIGQSIDKISSAEQMEINGFTVYIDKYQDQYTSMMSYENNIYYIKSTNKDSIITIFEHMNHE